MSWKKNALDFTSNYCKYINSKKNRLSKPSILEYNIESSWIVKHIIFQGFQNVRFYDDVTIKLKISQGSEYVCKNNQIYKQKRFPNKTCVDYGFINFS